MVDLAEILRRHWPAYQAKYRWRILPSHTHLVDSVLSCRTPALGGELYRCKHCEQDHYAYHSCNHRACPKCGHHEATAWIQKQKARLLPVPYFLVTFTVPPRLKAMMYCQQKLLYGLFFQETSGTLQDIALDPKHLGGQLGLLGLLQTWTRDLRYHPHIHYLVPAGALTEDGSRWIRPASADYFLPEKVLAMRFRNRLRQRLRQDYPELLETLGPEIWTRDWVADVQPVGRGEGALKYLSAYLYKTAITAQRLLACDEHSVTFSYRDRDTAKWLRCQLSAEDFLTRLLQHVLPEGFQRVRYYGWLAPASKKRWQTILALLDWKPPQPIEPEPLPPPLCPRCHKPMELIEELPRPPPDSS